MRYFNALILLICTLINLYIINCGCCKKGNSNKTRNRIATTPTKIEITKSEENNYLIKINNSTVVGAVIDTEIQYRGKIINACFNNLTKVIEIDKAYFDKISNNISTAEITLQDIGDKYLIAIVQNDKIAEPGSKYYIVICKDGNSIEKNNKNMGFFRSTNNNVIKFLGNGTGISTLSALMCFCENTEIFDMSKLNTTNVEIFSNFFNGCSSLEYINLTNFNTRNATYMSYMFSNCIKLKNLDLRNFCAPTISACGMFNGCIELETIELSGFESNNINIFDMFKNCNSLVCVKINQGNNEKLRKMLEDNGLIKNGNEFRKYPKIN